MSRFLSAAARALDGRRVPVRANPGVADARAARAVRTFFGRKPVAVRAPLAALTVPINPRRPAPVVALGELMSVEYLADRGDGDTVYRHPFNAASRPLLARSHDGRALYILGGGYRVTAERGIVDRFGGRKKR